MKATERNTFLGGASVEDGRDDDTDRNNRLIDTLRWKQAQKHRPLCLPGRLMSPAK